MPIKWYITPITIVKYMNYLHLVHLLTALPSSVQNICYQHKSYSFTSYPLVICYSSPWKITIEIVEFPINSMVIFHSFL